MPREVARDDDPARKLRDRVVVTDADDQTADVGLIRARMDLG